MYSETDVDIGADLLPNVVYENYYMRLKINFFTLLLIASSFLLFSCKNNGDNSEISKGGVISDLVEEEVVLPEVDDVCSQMDDPSFKAYCLKNFDADSDGKLSMAEADAVTELLFASPYSEGESAQCWEYEQLLQSLKGVEYFRNLEVLIFEDHQVTNLDVRRNTYLEYLYCSGNKIDTLNVSNNKLLKELFCFSCGLTGLDVSNNTELQSLSCSDNKISFLDVSKNRKLTYLACSTNQLTILDVSNNTCLKNLYCVNNNLTTLDLTNLPELVSLNCEGNMLTTLNLENNSQLEYLLCDRNKLTKLNLSNNPKLKLLTSDQETEVIGYKK